MSDQAPKAFDLAKVRERLASVRGRQVWTSLDELIDDHEFSRWLSSEFPEAGLTEGARRTFLKLMGASLLLGGLAACGQGRSDLAVPYVNQPEDMVPGVPRLYATAVEFDGYAQPVLATCHDGRPTKLDGNPQHPLTPNGGSDVFTQAAVLQLYDPDRSKVPLRAGQPETWAAFERELNLWRDGWAKSEGKAVRLLTSASSSPTQQRQIQEFLANLPEARWHLMTSATAGVREAAVRLALGRDGDLHYVLEGCDVIVSLDEDLLGPGPHQVAYARAWASRRGEIAPNMRARLHVAESTPSLTGVVASTRLVVDPSVLTAIAYSLASTLGIADVPRADLGKREADWVAAVSQELTSAKGRSLVACGAFAAPELQALALSINDRLGNLGHTVHFTEPIGARAVSGGTLHDLVRDMYAGMVETLFIIDANPVYATPAALGFADALQKVTRRIHAGLYRDETAALCDWHLPASHALESWGDARAVDGTATIMQPLVGPLYSSRTKPQIMAMLLSGAKTDADQPVRKTWMAWFGGDFQGRWRQSLHDGFVADSSLSPLQLPVKTPALAEVSSASLAADTVELMWRPDPCVWDGHFANVAWLQEMPKPLSKIVWGNPIGVSPKLADALQLANGTLIEVAAGEQKLVGPAWVTPGQAPRTVVLYLGYGHESFGGVASGLGYSGYTAMPADGAWLARGHIRRLSGSESLVSAQLHHRMQGSELVREVSRTKPALPPAKPQPTLYPRWPDSDHAWAMVIDLDRCIGCNACIAACNVENNVLVVGKEQVAVGREMLWLRVDHYYIGDVESPRQSFQPVPCMHCEKAPCEMGCPVHATVHSRGGINQMVYNRCIGTRTCSSYCPYKVRRFNWFDYRRFDEPSQAAHNPDVTVRSRGVMEKCTFCTQRVQAAQVTADKENRKMREGEVVTACQQACPTAAISFGNLKDQQSTVSKLRQSGRHYALLEELGTRPRTTYLARWNDDPEGE
jgi:MoCo/4Fe-4S cofactor protein with predicted Tat translocation signal